MKKQNISTLKKKLWKVFSEYIRKRDKGICISCGRYAEGSGYHAGHFIAKSVGGITLYFDEENVNGQCYHCNINLGGNQWEYGQRLGEEKVKRIQQKKFLTSKWGIFDYEKKIKEYQEKIKNL